MTPGANGTVYIGHTDMLRLFEVRISNAKECNRINNILLRSSDRSARIMSIFQETRNSKQSENSDNKTGDYSSFKFSKKWKVTKYAPSISQLLIIPCIGHSRSYFLSLVLNGKKVLIC